MDDQNAIPKTDGIKEQNPLIQDRTVVALFAGEDDARQAQQALIEAGYDKVVVTSNGADATDPKAAPDHGFWDSVKAFFGGHKDVHLYGEGLRRGQTLVTVHTEQGRAAGAVDILDGFHPTDVEGAEQAWRSEGWAETDTTTMDDLPAEDRPAYLAASADMGEAEPAAVVIAVVERPQSDARDPAIGNARIRSYVPGSLSDDVALRDDDSVLSDTDEDGLPGHEAEAADAPNKAWLDRTHGLEDRVETAGRGAANDRDTAAKT
jgi:hypothetical protein